MTSRLTDSLGETHDGVTLPYFPLDEAYLARTFSATEEQRFQVLARLFEAEGRTLAEVPAAHMRGPLAAWCWLVLTTNGIEPEYQRQGSDVTPFPLSHYGIDFGFATIELRRWVWFLA
jgi:hypothetical protein